MDSFVFSGVTEGVRDIALGYNGDVKIIFLPVITLISLSFPLFCLKLEQTLHKQQEQHS